MRRFLDSCSCDFGKIFNIRKGCRQYTPIRLLQLRSVRNGVMIITMHVPLSNFHEDIKLPQEPFRTESICPPTASCYESSANELDTFASPESCSRLVGPEVKTSIHELLVKRKQSSSLIYRKNMLWSSLSLKTLPSPVPPPNASDMSPPKHSELVPIILEQKRWTIQTFL